MLLALLISLLPLLLLVAILRTAGRPAPRLGGFGEWLYKSRQRTDSTNEHRIRREILTKILRKL